MCTWRCILCAHVGVCYVHMYVYIMSTCRCILCAHVCAYYVHMYVHIMCTFRCILCANVCVLCAHVCVYYVHMYTYVCDFKQCTELIVLNLSYSMFHEMGGACGTYEEKGNANMRLVGKPRETGQLWRHRHRGKDNVKLGVKQIQRVGVQWINLSQDRYKWQAFVDTATNLRVP
jgi:hypothetical protein